ncbi:MAG: alpha/beta fold hydrolase [Aeromicrobium sp.]
MIHSSSASGSPTGLRLHVRESGRADGPPILFIHGWSQNLLCWAKHHEGALADEFRLVAYDLRGHGMSEAPLEPEHYTDDRLWAEDVAAIIDELREAAFGTLIGPGFLDHLADATADDLPTTSGRCVPSCEPFGGRANPMRSVVLQQHFGARSGRESQRERGTAVRHYSSKVSSHTPRR